MKKEFKKIMIDLLYYEFWMLKSSYDFLGKKPISKTEKNIGIELFLMHVRNIVYFLENRKYKSDVRCSDFEIDAIKVGLPLGNNLREIDKYLSHLTKERISNQKPRWELKKIKDIIEKELKNFSNKLPELLKNYSFRKLDKVDKNLISKSLESIMATTSDV